MKFLDLFSGIGGFRLGLENSGHECVGYVEWDKYARKSYEAIHKTEGEFTAHDITRITDEEIGQLTNRGIDIICGGFPCQAFSVAGKRGGFSDTRGTLFFEIARIAKQIKPRILLLENVKGLLSHEQGRTFGTILNTLDELGYDCEWQVLNSKNFGVPQNRERVFIIGHLRGTSGREVFPFGGTNGENDISIRQVAQLDTGCQQGVVARDNPGFLLQSKNGTFGKLNKYPLDGIGPTITATCYKEPDMIAETGLKIRKLTPRECWRLQGFPDRAFNKAQAVNSDSQLYKQAGNSVTVNVIQAIAERL